MTAARRFITTALWALMAAGAVYVAYVSAIYIFAAPSAFPLQPDAPAELIGFRLHALGGVGALLLGPIQFLSIIRTKAPVIHRWTGRAYVLFVAIGAIGAVMLAMNPQGGAVTRFAFLMLAALWIVSTAMALFHALRRQFVVHRQWMIRSYALTFAAVTLRLGIPALMIGLGMTGEEAFQTVAWASWTLNLIVAEWLIVPKGARYPNPAV